MKKENCTKGPVKAEMSHAPNNGLQRDSYDLYGADGSCFATMRGEKKEANAELIAEAFNTLHTSGFTPAELYDQLQCALEKLRAIDPTPPTLSGSSI